jgi:selenide,water dikinase
MAHGAGVQIELQFDRLLFYPNAIEMYRQGETTGSNQPNRKLADGFWEMKTDRTA